MTPIRASDLCFHRVMTALEATQDSGDVVFLVSRPDLESDSYRSSLWHWVEGRPQRLVGSRSRPVSPKLSTCGRLLAYLAKAEKGGTQLRVVRPDERSDRAVGEPSKTMIGIQAWSPDGQSVLVNHRVGWKEDEFDNPAGGESRPRVTRYLPYKQDGGGIQVGFRTECRVLEVATGKQSVVLSGDFDVAQAAWSADGKTLAYIRNRSTLQRHFLDLWVANADGSEARQLTQELVAVNAFAWSPTGASLAVSGSMIEGDSIAELFLVDASSGAVRRACDEELQLESGSPVWHPDGIRIAVLIARNGMQELAVVNHSDGSVVHLHRGLSHVKSFSASSDGLVFIASRMRLLNELYRCDWDGGAERRITRFNRHWFSKRDRPQVVLRQFDVPDGRGGSESVDAWLLSPGKHTGPYPVLIDMHGGPQSTALVDFASHAYWYEMVSLGWMVVAPNCVGSASYGFDFARRLCGRWGELDLPQHLSILLQLRREGLVNMHAACAGQSYGGYLAAWALGHTDAFDSVVISAPVANIESHNGTSDTGYYVGPYAMNAELAENRERYRALSPIENCAAGDASVLLLQGEDDLRCPLGQSEEVFAHLIRSGKEATMVVYPGGSHSMSSAGKPSHRIDYHHRIAQWLQRRYGEAQKTHSQD